MNVLKGAALYGQSGGPTSVISASAAGIFTECLHHEEIEGIYAAHHGIKGILEEDLFDMRQEDPREIELLKTTPASTLGTVRYKLKDSDFERIHEVFQKYNIRYFFYNGGNDSMDTCNRISKYMAERNYPCRCIGIPKTIDNDLYGTDHTPGFASVAKYVATTIIESKCDADCYDTPMITIMEIMGRNAGWLAASSLLASHKGNGPDLIYVPEVVFDFDKFLNAVEREIKEKNGHVFIAVSEGIKVSSGKYVSELGESRGDTDSFGHAQMGGTASVLASFLRSKTKIKVRSLEPSIIQRSCQHLTSKVDVEEAFTAGKKAVSYAISGMTDVMVGFERTSNDPYSSKCITIPLSLVANQEKKFPREWIINDGTYIKEDFISYLLPLIQGEERAPLEDGLPRFACLKKVPVTLKN